MNKMKKLLSVLLAIVIALSCMSVTASAVGKAEYKTVDNLNALGAYSPYGEVTRLSTETRMSIILDELDIILGKANINLGTLVDVNLLITKLKLTVDLRSINALLGTVDEAYALLEENGLVSIAKGALGILGDAELGSWEKGMTRESKDQLYIIGKLLNVLADNKGLVYDVLSTGELDLGLIGSFIGALDISVIANIPGLIKPMIFGLFERWDDTLSEIKTLDTNAASASGGIESTLNTFVKNLFNNDMSITTVKYDKDGKMTSEHTNMPIRKEAPEVGKVLDATADKDAPRCVYVVDGNTLKIYHIVDEAEAKASQKTTNVLTAYTYVEQEETYYLEQEEEGSETYVWKTTDEFGNDTTLEWYNDASPFLPGFDGDSINLSTMSAAELLYTFIPPVFSNMAPVVLNGSIKKILAEFFGAQFTYVGLVGDDAVKALPDASNAFFTEEQGEYLWEWSNYAVINGNHYWRFEDQIWAGDLSKKNNYFDIIDWDYEITDDFMNEFVPADGKGSESNTLLMNLNNLLIKVAETITKESVMTEDSYVNPKTGEKFTAQWTRPTLTKGGNENLVANIKAAAQTVIKLAPQHIFGSDYETNPRCYFNLLTSNDNQTVLTGIAATLVDALMPQMILPTKNDLGNTEVGAILAAVVRELATQLVPQNNYDALIYADYGTSTTDKVKTFLTGKGNDYWLDVCLVMGMDIGIKYLHNLADMGGDTAALKEAIGWGIDKTWKAEEATIEATRGYWEALLNYIVDWGLGSELYQWKMSNLVTVDGNTVWEKLDDVFFGILPLDEILNVTLTDSTSKTEQVLRYDLILALLNLEWQKVTNLVRIPDESVVRKANVLDELALLIKGIVNSLFKKVGGGSYDLLPAGMTDLDSLADQGNLATLARDLLGALPKAFSNGLLDTVLPFVNFFLGWTTNPQKYADPDVTFKNESDLGYMYTSGSTVTSTMVVRNASSGMLYKHRNPTKTDSPYTITIIKVESEDVAVTASGDLNTPIQPGATGNINLSFAYPGEKAVMLKITYLFKGKDGSDIGGEQYKYVQQYTSNQKDDSTVMVAGSEQEAGSDFLRNNAKVKKDDHVRYMFVNNLGQVATFGYKFANTGKRKNVYVATGTYSSDTAPAPFTMFATSKWVHGSSEVSSKLPHGAMKHTEASDKDKQSSYTLLPYQYDSTSTVKYESGTKLNLPVLTYIGWRNDKNKSVAWSNDQLLVDFYYYDIASVEEVYGECAYALEEDFANATDAQWSTFKAARDAAVNLIMGPKMVATFTTEYAKTNVETVAANLEAAYDALVETNKDQTAGSAVGTTNLKPLTEALDRDEVYRNKGVEINFQDYDLYEYFVYGDLRTEARNVIASQEKPKVMDRYYILGSGISEAELDKVIAAESNSFIAAGITASRLENKQEAIDASKKASNDYVIPVYSDLFIEDMASRLDFYRQFLQVNTKIPQFLEKEIAYAKAQQYDSTKYTADTWAAYSTALDKAEKVVAGTYENADLMSVVFQAKWDLMTTQKQLLLKANSLIEQGGTATLKANIITAEAIFTSLAAGDGAWALAADYEGTAEEAYAQLISALGYYYTGEDGNEWNLYADSAYKYRDNDRPNKTGNQAKVNAANDALVAAIGNFEAKATEIEVAVKEDYAQAEFVIYDTANTNNDEYTGIIYGIDVLDQNPDFAPFTENGLMDALTTTSGDDYMVITPNAQGIESTGALVEVFDANGEVKATYVFVYFGDIDGDGMITAGDAAIAEYYEVFYEGFNTYAEYVASDLDTDGMTTAGDAAIMEYYEVFYEGVDYQYNLGQVAVNNTYEWM